MVAQWGTWSLGFYGVVSLDQTLFDGILLFSCSAMGPFFGFIPTFGASQNIPVLQEAPWASTRSQLSLTSSTEMPSPLPTLAPRWGQWVEDYFCPGGDSDLLAGCPYELSCPFGLMAQVSCALLEPR